MDSILFQIKWHCIRICWNFFFFFFYKTEPCTFTLESKPFWTWREAAVRLPFPLTGFSSCRGEQTLNDWSLCHLSGVWESFHCPWESLHFHTPHWVGLRNYYLLCQFSPPSCWRPYSHSLEKKESHLRLCPPPSLWNPDPDVLCREELPLLGPLARRLQSLPVACACPTGSEDVVLLVLGPGAWDCCCWYWANCWRVSFSCCWRTRMVLCIPSTSSSSWMMKSFSSVQRRAKPTLISLTI